ncbi:hypothetical protein H5T89_07440, partial [bacterium]|nr:hypothetical protein [bacterium]
TNILLAMVIFPIDKEGNLTMAGEIRKLYEDRKFQLVVNELVAEEARIVIAKKFPGSVELLEDYLSSLKLTPKPSALRVERCKKLISDVKDAPILASVLQDKPNYFCNNDIKDFHTERIKRLLARRDIILVTPYGLLKAYNLR